jgi:F-type H+-transporting ATPase subunit epsilon
MKTPLISITVKEPEKTIFDGFATTITSVSNRGKFDILAFHANFIALIQEKIILGQEGKEDVVIPIKTGVMKVQKNTVKIILGIETKAQGIK